MHILALTLLACSTPDAPSPDVAAPPEALDVVATSFPAAWLAERIGGDAVVVENVLPVGEDAPFWQAPADVIARAQAADLIVANGASYEKWMAMAALPEDRVVRSADGLDLLVVQGVTHSHGRYGKHSHTGTDPHTFGAPNLYLAQARVVHAALVHAIPAQQEGLDARLAGLTGELEALDGELEAALAPAVGLSLASSHPAFEYVERRYGLSIQAFELDPEEPAGPEVIAAVETWAATADPAILLWESEPTPAVLAVLPDGIRHVTIDPLEQPGVTGSYDYLAQARANVEVYRALFTEEPG